MRKTLLTTAFSALAMLSAPAMACNSCGDNDPVHENNVTAVGQSNSESNSDSRATSVVNTNVETTNVNNNLNNNANTNTNVTNVETGDNTQTNSQSVTTGPTTVNGGSQNVSFSNEYRAAANAASPNVATLVTGNVCQSGKSFSAGIGLMGVTLGGGNSEVQPNLECLEMQNAYQRDSQESAEAHAQIIEQIRAESQMTIARTQAATTIAVTGMEQMCNRGTASQADQARCVSYTDTAITNLFGKVSVNVDTSSANETPARVQPQVVTRYIVTSKPQSKPKQKQAVKRTPCQTTPRCSR